MPRSYGTTNVAPYTSAPAVGPSGDSYWNTTSKILYVSDGTNWVAGGGSTGPWSGSIVAPITANTTYTLTHSLNTSAPIVQLWDAVTKQAIQAQVTALDANRISVVFATAPPNGVTVVVSTGGGGPGPTASNVYYLTYYQTVPAVQAGSPYVLNHKLNSTQIIVQLWDAVTSQMVQAQVTIIDANNVRISVAQNMPNAVNAVVMIGPSTPAAVQPGDMASKSYVDARTPNLPAPVTSGSGVQSYTDPTGEVWVAANGVRSGNWYRARDVLRAAYHRSAAWNTATGGTTLAHDALDSDPYGIYNPSTGVMTAPIAGIWRADHAIACNPTASGQWLQCNIATSIGTGATTMSYAAATTWFSSVTWLERLLPVGGTYTTQQASSTASLTGRVDGTNTRCSFSYQGTG